MMYRLSITFWVFTVFTLIFSATLFILDIVYKSSIVKDCEESLESLKTNTSSDSFDDTDCNHVANVYLVKEAIRLFSFEKFPYGFNYLFFFFFSLSWLYFFFLNVKILKIFISCNFFFNTNFNFFFIFFLLKKAFIFFSLKQFRYVFIYLFIFFLR